VQLTLVANQPMNAPASRNINTLQVPRGFDVADDEIVKRLEAGDLVITSDMRDFMDTMRSSGVEMGGGPSAYSQRDKQEFANNLDRFLTRYANQG